MSIEVTSTDPTPPVLELSINLVPFPISGGHASFTPPSPGVYHVVVVGTDPAGNIGTQTARLGVADPADLLPPSVARMISVNGSPVLFDDNGNQLTAITANPAYCEWDSRNRLMGINFVSGSIPDVHFAYDIDGYLISRTRGQESISYLLDPNRAYPSTVGEATPTGIVSYAYDGDKVVFEDRDAGEVIRETAYEAFGRPIGPESNDAYGFSGERTEPATGLDYLRSRYFDPATGRFLSRHPDVGFRVVPASQNPYPYGHNGPTFMADPSGEIVVGPVISVIISLAVVGTLLAISSPAYAFGNGCSSNAYR